MGRRTKTEINEELEQTKARLKSYLEREQEMLSKDGVKAYGIGSRNLQRYDTSLAEVQAAIENLRKRIRELEAEKAGGKPRRAISAVPRDW